MRKKKQPMTMHQQQVHAQKVKEHNKLVTKHTKDFTKWKAALREMINKESQCIITEDGQSASFILPRRLVKLVWEVTIRERIKAEVAEHGEEGAAQRAINRLRAELEQGMDLPKLTPDQEPTELTDPQQEQTSTEPEAG